MRTRKRDADRDPTPERWARMQKQILMLSLLAVVLVWVADAGIGHLLSPGGNYIDRLFLEVSAHDIYTRAIVIVALLFMAFAISKVVRRLEKAEARTKHLNRVLRAIRIVNLFITRETDRDQLIQGVCTRLIERRGYEGAWIALRGAGNEITACAHSGCGKDFQRVRDLFDNGMLPECARRAFCQSDAVVVKTAGTTCKGCPLADRHTETGTMTVRLEYGGTIYGVLSVSLPTQLVVEAEERGVLEELAGDIALALNSIELEEKRRWMQDVQHVLFETANAVHTAGDLTDLIDKIRQELGIVLNTQNFFVALYDKEDDTISLAYFADEKDQETYTSFPAGKTQTAYVIRNNTPLLVTHDEAVQMMRRGEIEMIGTPSKIWLGVPLRARDDVIGALVVQSYDNENEFGEDDLEMLTFVSDQISLSIERKRVEDEVRKQRRDLATILDSVPAYIFYKDREGRYVRVNRAVAEMTGIPEDEWIGKTTGEILPEFADSYDAADQDVLRTGEPRSGTVEQIETPRGTRQTVTERIPYKDAEGNVVGVVSLAIDVTDRMKAEEALEGKEEELRQSQKMEAVGKLAGGVAHDFNNLLTAISGYTDLSLDMLKDDDPIKENLAAVKQASTQASSLTRQLLAFSRRQPLTPTVQSLNDIVGQMREILRRLIGEDVELATDCCDELPSCNVDASQVEQVIMNLCVNARDAMPEGGTLTLKTEEVVVGAEDCAAVEDASPGRYVCLSISDTGVGMDRETMAQIFEPFFTTKGAGQGTGLGLSVVYGNVRQHGGWIHVYSEPGRGSMFRIYIPAVETEGKAEAVVETSAAAVPGGTGERILLVEDENVVRDFAVRALKARGYTVVAAETAEEALTMFEREKGAFELVFSDVVLPGKSGVQLVDEILARKPEVPVLLSSGYADRKSQWPVIQERGFHFLQKPYSLIDLLNNIREILQ